MEKKMIGKYMDVLGYDDMPDMLKKYLMAPSLLRLKNVGYFCGMDYASKEVYDFGEMISRYDHSLTVALLTWKLTKDIRATLAGLFHDISTPCFSHVIDYMNKDYSKQESTEEKTEETIYNDKYLLDCLAYDGILPEEIIDFKRYSIVDLDRPMLCADRLDGVILTGLFWTKSISLDDVKKIISDIIITRNENGVEEIGFINNDIAMLVLKTSELIDVYCHSNEDNYMMELLALITKRALSLNLITYDDLFLLNEEELFSILEKSDDIELRHDLLLFRTVKVEDIPKMEMPYIKTRDLNPFVGNVRIK